MTKSRQAFPSWKSSACFQRDCCTTQQVGSCVQCLQPTHVASHHSSATTTTKKNGLVRGSRVPARAFHNMAPCAQWRLMRGVVLGDVISIAAAQELHWGRRGSSGRSLTGFFCQGDWQDVWYKVGSFFTLKLIRGAGFVNSAPARVLPPIIGLWPTNKDPELRMTVVSWWSLQLWEATCDVMKGHRYLSYVTVVLFYPLKPVEGVTV